VNVLENLCNNLTAQALFSLEGAEHGRKLHPQQVNGTEAREKPHTLAEYAMDHFR
jgi:myosin-7